MSNAEKVPDILNRIPSGFGHQTGLDTSIPAVRVWGVAVFERSYSGNEARGTNEAFTDLEAFVRPSVGLDQQPEFDARARVRATKFNYVRESYFRELIRRIAEPYLKEVADRSAEKAPSKPTTIESATPPTTVAVASDQKTFSQRVDTVFDEVLKGLVEPNKQAQYRSFVKALLIKTAACSPATPCGACPACIAEGSAATTQAVGVSLPHNWEKKFKETDFKTFRTARSSAQDLLINVDGEVLEPSLTEVVVRNRMPRAGDNDTATAVDTAAQTGRVAVGGQMILREHMFKGAGYIKTTVFNPTKLELAMLAYEHLVEDVRRGAKTSSGAGVWSWCRTATDPAEPLLVVDEVCSSRGFTVHPPVAGVPLDVATDDRGIERCFNGPLSYTAATSPFSAAIRYAASGERIDGAKQGVGEPALIRYVGAKAVERLGQYLAELDVLENNGTPEERFESLARHASSIIARLIKPRKAIENILAEFEHVIQGAVPPSGAAGGQGAPQKPTRGKKQK